MSDDRTAEQRKADEELTAAIEANMRAYNWTDGLLTDYVVVTVQQNYSDDGSMTTAYGSLYRDNGLPWYRIIGLLRAASVRAEAEFLAAREDES